MISSKDVHYFKYFDYGEAFYGSDNEWRFRIGIEPLENIIYKKKEERENYKLKAYIWKGPYNFVKTEEKLSEIFDYTEEGLQEAISWINEHEK